MQFTERLDVPVALTDVWTFMWQVDRVAACLPGCEGVTELEPERRYRARIADRVGPYKLAFDLEVVVAEVVPLQRLHLVATGADTTLGVSQRITLAVTVHEQGPTRTRVDVVADVEVQGAIASLGQFFIKRKAADIVKQFARNVDSALRRTA